MAGGVASFFTAAADVYGRKGVRGVGAFGANAARSALDNPKYRKAMVGMGALGSREIKSGLASGNALASLGYGQTAYRRGVRRSAAIGIGGGGTLGMAAANNRRRSRRSSGVDGLMPQSSGGMMLY